LLEVRRKKNVPIRSKGGKAFPYLEKKGSRGPSKREKEEKSNYYAGKEKRREEALFCWKRIVSTSREEGEEGGEGKSLRTLLKGREKDLRIY